MNLERVTFELYSSRGKERNVFLRVKALFFYRVSWLVLLGFRRSLLPVDLLYTGDGGGGGGERGEQGFVQWPSISAISRSIPGVHAICGLSLLLVLVPAPRVSFGFSLLPPSTKTNRLPNSYSTR